MSNNITKDILLAEDEEHIAKLIQFKLGRSGFQVTVARNGQEAVDQLESRPWALVILDVMMPILNGWEVLKVLKSHPTLKALPVLMLTAKGSQADVANAVDLGAEHFLKKPFDPEELSTLVKGMVKS